MITPDRPTRNRKVKPWQKAKRWQMENSEVRFEELLVLFCEDGYVWSSPTEFMLFVPVRVESGEIVEGEPNAWYVQLAAGKDRPFRRLMEIAPMPMDYVCWHRGTEVLRVYSWDTFKRKVKKWEQQEQQ